MAQFVKVAGLRAMLAGSVVLLAGAVNAAVGQPLKALPAEGPDAGVLFPLPPAATAPARTKGALEQAMNQAYAGLKSYQATVKQSITEVHGRVTQIRISDYKIAVDRAANKFALDHAMFMAVSDGQKFRLRDTQDAHRHLEVAVPAKLDLASINAMVPVIVGNQMPDVAALLSGDALDGFAVDATKPVTELPAGGPSAWPGLTFTDKRGMEWTVRIDPASHLLRQASLKISLAGMGGGAGDSATLGYDIMVEKTNQPIEAAAFAFDIKGSKAFASIAALQAGGDAMGEPPDEMLGQAAPTIELNNLAGQSVKLADEKAEVVVLTLWASWSEPSKRVLASAQQVHDWAQKQNKSVAVFGIDFKEAADKAAAAAKELKLTMPVLLDTTGKMGDACGAQVRGIPVTLVIHRGKIVSVYDVAASSTETWASEVEAEIGNLLGGAGPATAPAKP